MKTLLDSAKTFLKYSNQVLGISHIYMPPKAVSMLPKDIDSKKVFNFYLWPGVQCLPFESRIIEGKSIRTLFVFLTNRSQFEVELKNQTGMVSKMNQALGGQDSDLMVGWLTPNSEIDFFSLISKWTHPIRIILFRDEATNKSAIYDSGAHKILETVSPLLDISDNGRKRIVWNEFKRLLAAT